MAQVRLVFGALFLFAALASAQDAEPQRASDPVLEVVEVIGTRISRRDYTSPSPVFTVTRETLELAGLPSLEEHLNSLPQFSPDYDKTSVNPGTGQAVLNLRGLGANRNLLLLDGKRMAPSGTGGVIDINTLPTAMVERVEVLTGGASAIYGSDAMSGIVNFVTRQDFEGLEVSGNYDISEQGDSDIASINVAGGLNFAGGRGNVNAFIDVLDREPTASTERSFATVRLVDNFFTGELMPTGSTINAAGTLNGNIAVPPLGNITFSPSGDPRPFMDPEDRFNFFDYTTLQSGLERVSGRLQLSYDFSDTLRGRWDLIASRSEVSGQIAPPTVFGFYEVNLDNPLLTPANRQLLTESFQFLGNGRAQLPLRKRMVDTGPRILEHKAESFRTGVVFEGRWLHDWNWSASWYYHEQTFDKLFFNTISASRLQQSLLVDPDSGECIDGSGGCVPANIFGEGNISADAAEFLRVKGVTDESDISMHVLQFSTDGAIDIGLAEPLGIAVGGEWRTEEGSFSPDPLLFTGDVIGFGASDSIDGDFDIGEIYAEAFLPVLRNMPMVSELSVELGARFSEHSDAGSIWSYKGGLSYSPAPSVRFRLMYQRAVRAPNLTELYTVSSEYRDFAFDVATGRVIDPCSAENDPVGNGYTDLCIAQGIAPDQVGVFTADSAYLRTFAQSGNTNLEPEQADTWTVGLVWEPELVDDLSIAIDWYRIEIADAIQLVAGGAAIDFCFESGNASGEFCNSFSRAVDGNIDYQLTTYRNIAAIEAEGVDVQIDYRFNAPAPLPGELALSLVGNWNRSTRLTPDDIAEPFECAGFFGFPCDVLGIGLAMGTYPEFRTNTALSWSIADFDVRLQWQWIGSVDTAAFEYPDLWFPPGVPRVLAVEDIDAQNYLDLHAGWQVSDNLRLIAGISNLTDREPPMMGWQSLQNNTDPSMYDVIGRRYHLNLRWRL